MLVGSDSGDEENDEKSKKVKLPKINLDSYSIIPLDEQAELHTENNQSDAEEAEEAGPDDFNEDEDEEELVCYDNDYKDDSNINNNDDNNTAIIRITTHACSDNLWPL